MTNEDVVKLYWDTCWNDRKVDRLADVFHDPYIHGRTEFTLARMADIIHGALREFSDFRVRVNETEVLSEVVITRSTFLGTQSGELFGLSPTGRAVELPTLDIFFFREGKVWRYWHLTDHLPILKGIGAQIRIGDEVADLDR